MEIDKFDRSTLDKYLVMAKKKILTLIRYLKDIRV